jgi:hypothetical protein
MSNMDGIEGFEADFRAPTWRGFGTPKVVPAPSQRAYIGPSDRDEPCQRSIIKSFSWECQSFLTGNPAALTSLGFPYQGLRRLTLRENPPCRWSGGVVAAESERGRKGPAGRGVEARVCRLGDVDWGAFISALSDAGYQGSLCVEVEDDAFRHDLAARQRSLRISRNVLRPLIAQKGA